MSSLKERFDQYNATPDTNVWTKISNTLRHKTAVRRRVIGASSAVVAIAAVGLFFSLNGRPATTGNSPVEVAQTSVVPQTSTTDATIGTVPSNNTLNMVEVEPASPQPTIAVAEPAASTAVAEEKAAAISPTQTSANEYAVGSAITTAPAVATTVFATSTSIAAPQPREVADNSDKTETNTAPKASTPQAVRPTSSSDELVVWIPTAFSPDDPNTEVQKFMVVPNNDAQIQSFEIFIYSRAGKQVYHSKDYTQGWDGIANGHKQPMGAYVYIIEIKDAVKGLQHTRGSVTLIR